MRLAAIVVFCGALAFAGNAEGHERWADGSIPPAWVAKACCGVADSHHLSMDQIHREAGGWRVDGYPDLIPDDKVLPSQDGDAWIFYRSYGNGQYSNVYCFFYPASI